MPHLQVINLKINDKFCKAVGQVLLIQEIAVRGKAAHRYFLDEKGVFRNLMIKTSD
jgi:hypothetical protein